LVSIAVAKFTYLQLVQYIIKLPLSWGLLHRLVMILFSHSAR